METCRKGLVQQEKRARTSLVQAPPSSSSSRSSSSSSSLSSLAARSTRRYTRRLHESRRRTYSLAADPRHRRTHAPRHRRRARSPRRAAARAGGRSRRRACSPARAACLREPVHLRVVRCGTEHKEGEEDGAACRRRRGQEDGVDRASLPRESGNENLLHCRECVFECVPEHSLCLVSAATQGGH
jgi:hypothetical protein